VTFLLKARIVEPEKTNIAKERLGKHFRSNRYTRSNTKTIVGGVFCAARAKAIYLGPNGYHVRIMTARVLLQKKSLVVGHKVLGAKIN
jgi:hypothetical protein